MRDNVAVAEIYRPDRVDTVVDPANDVVVRVQDQDPVTLVADIGFPISVGADLVSGDEIAPTRRAE